MSVIEEEVVSKPRFVPLPGPQTDFMNDYQHRFIALVGGKGSGKSYVGAQKLAELHFHNSGMIPGVESEPKQVRGLCVAQTYQMLKRVNVPQIEDAFARIGLETVRNLNPTNASIEIPFLSRKGRPSEILLCSADAPEKINGFEVGHAWCDESSLYSWSDEDPLQDAVVQTMGRMRDERAVFQQMLFTFTPEGTSTRMYQDFEFKPKPNHCLYRARTQDNPHVGEYAAIMREQYSAELASQYLDGKTLDNTAGRLFTSFDEAQNLDEGLRIDEHLPLQVAIDFNINPGMHVAVGQKFPSPDLLTTVYEIHEKRMDVPAAVRAIAEMTKGWRWEWKYPLEVYGDASGHSKHANSNETSSYDLIIANLRAAGIPFVLRVGMSNPRVADRVNHANSALLNATGQVRWKIHPRCKRLISDLKQMRWDKNGEVDKRDRTRGHMGDADTYRVHYLIPIQKIVWPSAGRVFVV